jgi:hypothetical protein
MHRLPIQNGLQGQLSSVNRKSWKNARSRGQTGSVSRRGIGSRTRAVTEPIIRRCRAQPALFGARLGGCRFNAKAVSDRNILDPMMLRTVQVGVSRECEMKERKAREQAEPQCQHRHQQPSKERVVTHGRVPRNARLPRSVKVHRDNSARLPTCGSVELEQLVSNPRYGTACPSLIRRRPIDARASSCATFASL